MRLLLIFAFPREITGILRQARRGPPLGDPSFRTWRVPHAGHRITAAETGLGTANARRVLLELLESERPDGVISLGYCGALLPYNRVGDLILGSRIRMADGNDPEILAFSEGDGTLQALLRAIPITGGTIMTMTRWMKKEELLRKIPRDSESPVCDMETYPIAFHCMAEHIPFYAIRAVSDDAGSELPFDPWKVCDGRGRYSLHRAIKLFILRPQLIAGAVELCGNSRKASRSLESAFRCLLRIL